MADVSLVERRPGRGIAVHRQGRLAVLLLAAMLASMLLPASARGQVSPSEKAGPLVRLPAYAPGGSEIVNYAPAGWVERLNARDLAFLGFGPALDP